MSKEIILPISVGAIMGILLVMSSIPNIPMGVWGIFGIMLILYAVIITTIMIRWMIKGII